MKNSYRILGTSLLTLGLVGCFEVPDQDHLMKRIAARQQLDRHVIDGKHRRPAKGEQRRPQRLVFRYRQHHTPSACAGAHPSGKSRADEPHHISPPGSAVGFPKLVGGAV